MHCPREEENYLDIEDYEEQGEVIVSEVVSYPGASNSLNTRLVGLHLNRGRIPGFDTYEAQSPGDEENGYGNKGGKDQVNAYVTVIGKQFLTSCPGSTEYSITPCQVQVKSSTK